MTEASPNREHSNFRRIVLGGVLLAAGAIALAFVLYPTRPPARVLQKLVIASNADYVGTCPVTVAQRKGYFADAGIDLQILPYKSGKASLEAALAGQADLATSSDIPIMLAAMNDVPVSVVATFFKTDHDHGIVARRDRGFKALTDIKGKTIGATLGTSGHFVLDAFLIRQHLSPSDVTLRDLRPEEFANALALGEVDAIATWEPFLDNLLTQLGPNGVVFYGEEIYEISYSIVGDRAYVKRNPELMKNVLRGLARGVDDCKSAPEASRAIMATTMEGDTSKLKANWPSYRFQLVLDQGLILTLEDETSWAVDNKLVPARAMPNFLDSIYLDAMVAVAPSAVTVIH